MLPPIPPWEGFHPIVVHYPIALLTMAPVFLILGALWKAQSRAMFLAYVLMLAAGTATAFIATATGEASEHVVQIPGVAEQALERHEDLGELARNLFLALTIVAGITAGLYWSLHARAKRGVIAVGALIMLMLHGAAALVLANAAHEGGRLVHEFGVRAPIVSAAAGTTSKSEDTRHERDEPDDNIAR